MYYLVDNDPDQRCDTWDELVETYGTTDNMTEGTEDYDDWLDDEYSVEINGIDFDASSVLRRMDEDAYYESYNDWLQDRLECQIDNARYESNHTNIGDYFYFLSFEVYVYEDEELDSETGELDVDSVTNFIEETKQDETKQNQTDTNRDNMFEQILSTGNIDTVDLKEFSK